MACVGDFEEGPAISGGNGGTGGGIDAGRGEFGGWLR